MRAELIQLHRVWARILLDSYSRLKIQKSTLNRGVIEGASLLENIARAQKQLHNGTRLKTARGVLLHLAWKKRSDDFPRLFFQASPGGRCDIVRPCEETSAWGGWR
jgi:hypothetical protein